MIREAEGLVEKYPAKDVIAAAALGVFRRFGSLAIAMKHDTFHSEREWRLVGIVPHEDIDALPSFKRPNGELVRYWPIAIQPEKITKVMLGSANPMSLDEASRLVTSVGANAEITRSRSTYRRTGG